MADEKTQVNQLTPMDIHNKEFKHRGRNGYDRYEVDSFLDKIVDNYGDALDEVVDLKNEIVSLNTKVEQLQEKADAYDEKRKQLQDSLISAQEAADIIKEKAHQEADDIVNNAKEQATIDANYEKQQKDVIADDYKRLKQKIGEFRSHMQAMLQKQIDNLNDDEWQQALDEYFNTDRFYPDDGSEPIPVADDEDIEDDDDEVIEQDDVDKQAPDDVNSYQDPSEGEEEPKPMTGDSPNTEQIDVSKPAPKKRSGTTIVFPDDYKDK